MNYVKARLHTKDTHVTITYFTSFRRFIYSLMMAQVGRNMQLIVQRILLHNKYSCV